MKSAKKDKNEFKENAKQVNAALLEISETIISEVVKTGEAWQQLIQKAIKNSEPLMKKQSEIFFETVMGMKKEAQHSLERFEQRSDVNFSEIKRSTESKIPATPIWVKERLDYVSGHTEAFLAEVSKKGDDIVDTITKTARSIAKDAEGLRDTVAANVIETLCDIDSKASDSVSKTSDAAADIKETVKKTRVKRKKASAKAAKKTKKATEGKSDNKAKKSKNKTKVSIDSDDLKVIEGIGPKLEQIFMAAGITTYTKLAKAGVSDLQGILDNAGSKYKRHNPSSFPLQARFARDGKFDALKVWQQENDAQKF